MDNFNKEPNQNLISVLSGLLSESQNPDTMDIDCLDTLPLVTKINQQDHLVSQAISQVLPQIASSVDLIVAALKCGGRLVYLGAGTSGRLGVLDAVECVPTFGLEEGIVVALLAGGQSAMFKAKEGVEDSLEEGELDLKSINFNAKDILVGIAASGRTPYVLGGLSYAQSIGAKTIALSCNSNPEIAKNTDIAILPIVGPEVLAGSTRMKSGTAQKLILNMLSTASMIRLGKSYQNLMIDVKATNHKLHARAINMIMQVTGVEQSQAEQALLNSGKQVKLAILMILTNLDAKAANNLLTKSEGFLRQALTEGKN